MPSKKEINELIHDIVRSQKDLKYASLYKNNFSKWLKEPERHRYSKDIEYAKISSRIISDEIIRSGRPMYGALKRYTQRPGVYRKSVSEFLPKFDDYLKQQDYLPQRYGWNTPLVATRFRKPSIGNQIENNDITSENDIPSRSVSSGSAPPIKPPNIPPLVPPSPPSYNDDDGKSKAPKKWGVYKHDFTNLLDGFNPEDYKKKSGRDDKSLKAEKDNTKGVNANTKALTGLRAYLGPFAKIALPYYSVKAVYDSLSSNTEAAVQRVKRRTFGGIYGTNKDRGHFKRMAHTMGSYGASMRDIRSEYANQKKWASVLEFGMGMDKIEAIAMILGKAPGPAEIKDEDKMQEWLSKNLYGISDHQARQLSALGVASDTFIESARKGSATDMIGEAARIRSRYEDLNKQIGVQENPFRKLEYTIGENLAESIAHGGIRGFVTEFGMGVLDKFGAIWQWIDNIGANEYDKRDQHALIPNQNNVTVNLYGNVDSEDRAHSFAEQIGAEVSNAEK